MGCEGGVEWILAAAAVTVECGLGSRISGFGNNVSQFAPLAVS